MINQAKCADWIPVYKSLQNESAYLVDQDSIIEDGSFAKAWVIENRNLTVQPKKLSPNKPENPLAQSPLSKSTYKSYVSLYVIDCDRKNTAIARGLYFSEFMGKGSVLSSFKKEIDSQILKSVKPGTLSEAVLNFVCTRVLEFRITLT